jgi:ethanolaminephosphotransferase
VQVGPGYRALIVLSSVSTTFYLAQWEEYHTGVMSCGNGWYGVTEGQLSLVMIHIMTAIIGPGLWAIKLPFIPFTTTDALVVLLVASNVVLAYSNITNVLNAPADAIPRAELGNKHVSKPLAVSQLIPIAILLVLGSLWVAGPNAHDYASYPVVFLFAIGIGYVLFSTRMITSHMCKIPFSPQLRVIIPFGLVVFNSYGPVFGLIAAPIIRPMLASSLYVLFIVFVYLHFVMHVVNDICDYLNIYLFKIVKKQQTSDSK